MNKKKRISSVSNPLKIVVLGTRQSGKTTFFTVAYHKTLGKIGHKIIPIGSHTIEKVKRKMKELENDKIKATDMTKCDEYSFKFIKNGREKSHQLCFDWLDYAGEYCDYDADIAEDSDAKIEFYNNTQGSDGCCIIIDSEKLLDGDFSAQHIEVLGQLLSEVRKSRRETKINRLKYPIAIVYTKTDLFPKYKDKILLKKLKEKTKSLLNQTSGFDSAYKRKIFMSKLFQNGKEVKSDGQLQTMIWLINKCKKNYSCFSAMKNIIRHPINSFREE